MAVEPEEIRFGDYWYQELLLPAIVPTSISEMFKSDLFVRIPHDIETALAHYDRNYLTEADFCEVRLAFVNDGVAHSLKEARELLYEELGFEPTRPSDVFRVRDRYLPGEKSPSIAFDHSPKIRLNATRLERSALRLYEHHTGGCGLGLSKARGRNETWGAYWHAARIPGNVSYL